MIVRFHHMMMHPDVLHSKIYMIIIYVKFNLLYYKSLHNNSSAINDNYLDMTNIGHMMLIAEDVMM